MRKIPSCSRQWGACHVAHLLAHQQVYSGSTNGKAHPIMCFCQLPIVQLLVSDRLVVDLEGRAPSICGLCASSAAHSVSSGGAQCKAHPNYVHLSASDCTTAGERQARCASPKDLYLRKVQADGSQGRPVMLPTAYADHAYSLEHAGATVHLQWKQMRQSSCQFRWCNCRSEMRVLYIPKGLVMRKM